MTPSALFQSGKPKEAITALVEEIKRNPMDSSRRGFLCELLCLTGDLERADSHLEAIGKQDPKAALAVALFRQLIRAEQARQQLFKEGRVPEFLDKPSERLQLHLKAIIALREQDPSGAAELFHQVESMTPVLTGNRSGSPFEGFRDLDDRTSTFFEVLTSNGKYYWIPFEQVTELEIQPIESPRDLLWRRASMTVADGPDGMVYLPALYVDTWAEADENLWIARGTDWREQPGGFVSGVGQRMFLVGEEDIAVHQLETVEFDAKA